MLLISFFYSCNIRKTISLCDIHWKMPAVQRYILAGLNADHLLNFHIHWAASEIQMTPSSGHAAVYTSNMHFGDKWRTHKHKSRAGFDQSPCAFSPEEALTGNQECGGFNGVRLCLWISGLRERFEFVMNNRWWFVGTWHQLFPGKRKKNFDISLYERWNYSAAMLKMLTFKKVKGFDVFITHNLIFTSFEGNI